MKMRDLVLACGAILCTGTSVVAQTGTLDQDVPFPPPPPLEGRSFNGDLSTLAWQQQARCGITGLLEGVELFLEGEGSQLEVSIGLGEAWKTEFFFTTTITVGSGDVHYVDASSSNVRLDAGDVFVIQLQGTDTGTAIHGSYIAPPGEPQYEEPLYLNENVHVDGGSRIAFRSYMIEADDCLRLSNSGYIGGQPTTWLISGGAPGQKGVVVYGFNAGHIELNNFDVAGREWCAIVGIAGVNPSKIVGNPKVLDANGEATWTKTIPLNQVGNTILTQALGSDTCPDDCYSVVDSTTVL